MHIFKELPKQCLFCVLFQSNVSGTFQLQVQATNCERTSPFFNFLNIYASKIRNQKKMGSVYHFLPDVSFRMPKIWICQFEQKSLLFISDHRLRSNIFQFIPFQNNNVSYYCIFVGRLLNGVGCGIGMTISPIYLTELAPLHLRGAFGTSYSLL